MPWTHLRCNNVTRVPGRGGTAVTYRGNVPEVTAVTYRANVPEVTAVAYRGNVPEVTALTPGIHVITLQPLV